MSIKRFPLDSLTDFSDLTVNDLQQITNNLDIEYDALVSRGRGIVSWFRKSVNVTVTGTVFAPTVIASDSANLVIGRLYKMVMQFNNTVSQVGALDVSKQNVNLTLNGAIIRSTNFYTPNAPTLEGLFVAKTTANVFSCNGILIAGTPTNWQANFSTAPGYLYIEDLGDPGSVVLP